MEDTQVVIVGGSLVGLSAACFLAWYGVDCVLIEKHSNSALHPRATGFTESTLEVFRTIGIADRIPKVERDFRLRRARVESLSGRIIDEIDWTPKTNNTNPSRELSPAGKAAFAQDKLEPILRARARELGADLRLGTEMLAFVETVDGVKVHMRERTSGREYFLDAAYMIAADGSRSTIRETLNIPRRGVGHLMNVHSVLFHCEAANKYLEQGFQQFEIEQDGFRAFLTTYGDNRWALMFYDSGNRPTEEYAKDIGRALGVSLSFEIIAFGTWEMAGLIADYYSTNRIFLSGDAAHQLPPTRGGFGANTGIADVWNLSWKLQSVLSGISSPKLLDSYSQERQPVGWLRHQQTFARPDYSRFLGGVSINEPLLGDDAMELGQLHRSDIIIGAGADLQLAAHPDDWAGQPGVRAPHLPIEYNGRSLSTIDVFPGTFTLITEEPGWIQFGRKASQSSGVPLTTFVVGIDLHVLGGTSFKIAYGTGLSGASLVRPDGIVAWRTSEPPETSGGQLDWVMRMVAAV